MSYLDRIAACNAHDMAAFRPFRVDGRRVGWVKHDFAQRLAAFVDVFDVSDEAVDMASDLADFASRTEALDEVLRGFASTGLIRGWRDEPYPVTTSFAAPPLLQMERAGIPHFGVTAYGVHLNGYVRRDDGIHLWIARRARGKHTYPGKLDNMVAGGQPIGISLRDNLTKECGEEASMPPDLAARAVPVGCLTYTLETPEGLKPDVLFTYDIEMPADFVPRPNDSEVEKFHLWPLEQVASIVRETEEFKFNCNLVVIDFLVRHGIIPPDDPDYVAICRGLRR